MMVRRNRILALVSIGLALTYIGWLSSSHSDRVINHLDFADSKFGEQDGAADSGNWSLHKLLRGAPITRTSPSIGGTGYASSKTRQGALVVDVVDTRGVSVPNALISIRTWPSRVAPSEDGLKCTDSDGRVEWRELRPGQYLLECGGGDCSLAQVQADETVNHRVILKQPRLLTVVVFDSVNTPVGDAVVALSNHGSMGLGRPLGRTDRSGRLSLALDNEGHYAIYAQHSRAGTSEYHRIGAQRSGEILLTLAPWDRSMEVSLVSAGEHTKIDGAQVVVHPALGLRNVGSTVVTYDRPPILCTPSGNGKYRSDGIPDGAGEIRVEHSGFVPHLAKFHPHTSRVAVELIAGLAIEGRVVDELYRPVASVFVGSTTWQLEGRAPTMTSHDGAFRLEGLSADATVIVSRTEFEDRVLSVEALMAELERDCGRIVIVRSLSTRIAGRVEPPVTLTGELWFVRLRGADPRFKDAERWAHANVLGEFEFLSPTACGQWSVEVLASGRESVVIGALPGINPLKCTDLVVVVDPRHATSQALSVRIDGSRWNGAVSIRVSWTGSGHLTEVARGPVPLSIVSAITAPGLAEVFVEDSNGIAWWSKVEDLHGVLCLNDRPIGTFLFGAPGGEDIVLRTASGRVVWEGPLGNKDNPSDVPKGDYRVTWRIDRTRVEGSLKLESGQEVMLRGPYDSGATLYRDRVDLPSSFLPLGVGYSIVANDRHGTELFRQELKMGHAQSHLQINHIFAEVHSWRLERFNALVASAAAVGRGLPYVLERSD